MEGIKSEEDLRPRDTIIDWVHLIQFGSIQYVAIWGDGEGGLTADDLGPELYRIAFKGDDHVGADYRYQDGDATYLSPGTPVHMVKGYAPEFRLGTLVAGRVTLFEADTNPLAKTGEDLLDIRGTVTAIDILSEEDAETVLGTINGERPVERFAELVLQSPVDQEWWDHDGPRYFVGFRLADGTSVMRSFWLESGELSRGIMTDPVVMLFVLNTLPENQWPMATDGGPRISERLAARLGLAYLSFAVPEIGVTGKPHSPVVRLMRRSEFEAMRGSAPAMPSDPLVWVVEAQGLWRTGGITPEEARQDLSVELVVFDADTGARFGRSHGNTSLLGTDDDAPLITPTPTPTPAPMPTVERDRLEEPPQGQGVEIGTGYPYTLYVHCGVRDARFDGRLWMANPMLSDGSGNPPRDWTLEDSNGFMEMVRDDLAVFTAKTGRRIEFIPWPSDVERRPCF